MKGTQKTERPDGEVAVEVTREMFPRILSQSTEFWRTARACSVRDEPHRGTSGLRMLMTEFSTSSELSVCAPPLTVMMKGVDRRSEGAPPDAAARWVAYV